MEWTAVEGIGNEDTLPEKKYPNLLRRTPADHRGRNKMVKTKLVQPGPPLHDLYIHKT